MPKSVERCVRKVAPKLKPRKKGQSKKSAAWAVCTASYKKKRSKMKRGKN